MKLLPFWLSAALLLSSVGRGQTLLQPRQRDVTQATSHLPTHKAATLGTDMSIADGPHVLIEAWRDREKGEALAAAFRAAGVRSLRFLFGGLYSPLGPEATAAIKAQNKLTNQYPWFPLGAYVDFLVAHDFTTVVGVNVEEGPDVARDAIQLFLDRGLKSRIVAVELSNEPWLNHRPWLPEEYAARAADVIEALTPLGVRFALPLTAGSDNNTPTKLSDNEWVTRMLRALSARVDLKSRSDIYGVLHLYSRGVRGKTVDAFNKVVKPFTSNMRYLVTEFNIRLSLEGNPHLTNEYAMEFALKLADVMSRPEIEAMYVHSVPYHSIMYWSNGRKLATVIRQRDARLTGEAMSRGWHLTPTGKVYELYSRLAWNGDVLEHRDAGNQSYWAVRASNGRIVVTMINESGKVTKKKVKIAGRELSLSAPARSIVCFDEAGQRRESLILPY
ncbi:MAG TPA: hypothetical protein VLU47_18305 [Blastocatellia bacterium]|nr:hypothetical protein [Blastocatellia bacterium]